MFSEDINDTILKYGDEYNFLYSPLQKSLLTIPGMTVDLEEKFKDIRFFTTYQLLGYCLQISKDEGRRLKAKEVFKEFIDIYFYEMKDDSYNIRINTNCISESISYTDEEYECILTEEEKERVKLVLYMILKKLEISFPDFVEFTEEDDMM